MQKHRICISKTGQFRGGGTVARADPGPEAGAESWRVLSAFQAIRQRPGTERGPQAGPKPMLLAHSDRHFPGVVPVANPNEAARLTYEVAAKHHHSNSGEGSSVPPEQVSPGLDSEDWISAGPMRE